jgi:hypothetical protein
MSGDLLNGVGLLCQEADDLESVRLSQDLEKAEKVVKLGISGHFVPVWMVILTPYKYFDKYRNSSTESQTGCAGEPGNPPD